MVRIGKRVIRYGARHVVLMLIRSEKDARSDDDCSSDIYGDFSFICLRFFRRRYV